MSVDSKSITPPEVRAQIEQSEALTNYFTTRLDSESYKRAVCATRGEIVGDYTAYSQEIVQTGKEIVRAFGIDEGLFLDPKYSEVLLALSESYVALHHRREDPTIQREQAFLTHLMRVVAGDNARVNHVALGDDPQTHNFIFSEKDHEAHAMELARYRAKNIPDKSEHLKQLLSNTSENGILTIQREGLGLTPDNEKLFDVIVVAASQKKEQKNDQSTDKSIKMSEWEQLGAKGKAFVMEVKNNPPTIILSQDTYDALHSSSETVREDALATIRHEFIHTQRKMRIGHQTLLGRILDEAMATELSGTKGHGDASALVDLMDMMSKDAGKSLRDVFNSSIKGDTETAEVYQFISDTFGPRGLLLVLATLPHGYKEETGLVSPTEFQFDTIRMSSLFRQLLHQRSMIDTDAEGKLERELVQLSPEKAQDLLGRMYSGRLKLPKNLEQIPRSVYKAYRGKEYRRN